MAGSTTYRARLSYQGELPEKIFVRFGGTGVSFANEVILGDNRAGDGYGDPALANLAAKGYNEEPFYIINENGTNYVYVKNADQFTITISEPYTSTSECFQNAVNEAITPTINYLRKNVGTAIQPTSSGTCNGNAYSEFNVSYADIRTAIAYGKPLLFTSSNNTDQQVILKVHLDTESLVEGGSVYTARLIMLSDFADNTPAFMDLTLYSDSEYNNMRNVCCWGTIRPAE